MEFSSSIEPKITLPEAVLRSILAQYGFGLVSWTIAQPQEVAAAALQRWQDLEMHGSMKFMQRAASLLSDPRKLLPEAVSVVTLAIPYNATPVLELPSGHGRVARYAWGRDYHTVIRNRLTQAVKQLETHLEKEFPVRAFSDAVPFLERAFAAEAGLGFVGKNTLLIRPRVGSYFFLADLIIGVAISGAKLSVIKEQQSCGDCDRCRQACPTAALETAYRLDARRCISYLTIEKRGLLASWERRALGEWIFGCDKCQEVCPFNHLPGSSSDTEHGELMNAWPEFGPQAGAGQSLNLSKTLALRQNKDFKALYSETALMRGGRAQLLRNAACVAVNTISLETIDALLESAKEDPSSAVRATSVWALSELKQFADGRQQRAVEESLPQALRDSSEDVRYEANLWQLKS